jgi:hypothetical protein
MTEVPDTLETNESNVELIYDYTNSLLKTLDEGLHKIDLRFNWIMVISGVLLKFSIDLPSSTAYLEKVSLLCISCKIIKILLLIALTSSILVSLRGIDSEPSGKIFKPEVLMQDKYYTLNNEYLRCKIIFVWVDTCNELTEIGIRKGERLKIAVNCIFTAFICFIIDSIILVAYS